MRHYEVKAIEENIVKDFDFKSRTVTGYFSRFGNLDHDNDIVLPGAFERSIRERGSEGKNIIPHIADHTMTTANVLAKPKLYEVADGGFFESKITDTTKGLDILKQYRDGLINQHSFGFKTLRKDEKNGHREIKEVLLYEISSVVLGSNDQTPFSGFKSLTKPQLVEKYQLLKKCYKDGDYSDDYFLILEAQLKQIEQEIIEAYLTEPQSTEESHSTPSSNDELLAQLSLIKLKI